MELDSVVSDVFSALGGILAEAVGGFDTLFWVLVGLMGLDVVLGACTAYYLGRSGKTKTGAFSWKSLRKGIIQKLLMFVVLAIATQLDTLLEIDLLRTAVGLYYVATEASSVLNLLDMAGVPLPAKLLQVVRIIESYTDSEYDDDTVSEIKENLK